MRLPKRLQVLDLRNGEISTLGIPLPCPATFKILKNGPVRRRSLKLPKKKKKLKKSKKSQQSNSCKKLQKVTNVKILNFKPVLSYLYASASLSKILSKISSANCKKPIPI